jgi:hypothetical protein
LKAAEDSGATSDTKSIQEEAEDTTNNDTTDPQSEDVAMVIDESISESAPQVCTSFLIPFSWDHLLIISRPLNPRVLPPLTQALYQCLTN